VAIAVNQVVSVTGSGVTSVTTASITTTTGNLFVANVAYYVGGGQPFSSITDSKSNSWSSESIGDQQSGTGGGRQRYVANGTGGSSHTFTYNSSITDYPAFVVYEVSGADTTTPLAETNNSGALTGGTSYSLALSVTCPPNKLILAYACSNWAVAETVSQTGSFTADKNLGSQGVNEANLSSHLGVTTTGSSTFSFSFGGASENYIIGMSAWKEAAAGDTLFAQASM